MILSENSLYKTSAERDELIKDKHAVADALLFNYFGFISLFAALARKDVKEWKNNELQVKIDNIGDDNTDVSLAVKLSLDAGNITRGTADKLTKLLSLFKQGKILKSSDVDDDKIHELFMLCKFDTSSKPNSQLLDVVSSYVDNEINIAFVARELYRKSRLPAFKETSVEFRHLFKNGSYSVIYSNLENGVSKINMGVPQKFVKQQTPKMIVHTPRSVPTGSTASATVLTPTATAAVDPVAIANVQGVQNVAAGQAPIVTPATVTSVGTQNTDGTLDTDAIKDVKLDTTQSVTVDPVADAKDKTKPKALDRNVQVTSTTQEVVNAEFNPLTDTSEVLDDSFANKMWDDIIATTGSKVNDIGAASRYTSASASRVEVVKLFKEQLSELPEVVDAFKSKGNFIKLFKKAFCSTSSDELTATAYFKIMSEIMVSKNITESFITLEELKLLGDKEFADKDTNGSAIFQTLLLIWYQYIILKPVKGSATLLKADTNFIQGKMGKNSSILKGSKKIASEVIQNISDYGYNVTFETAIENILKLYNQSDIAALIYRSVRILETVYGMEPESYKIPKQFAFLFGKISTKIALTGNDVGSLTPEVLSRSTFSKPQQKEIVIYYNNQYNMYGQTFDNIKTSMTGVVINAFIRDKALSAELNKVNVYNLKGSLNISSSDIGYETSRYSNRGDDYIYAVVKSTLRDRGDLIGEVQADIEDYDFKENEKVSIIKALLKINSNAENMSDLFSELDIDDIIKKWSRMSNILQDNPNNNKVQADNYKNILYEAGQVLLRTTISKGIKLNTNYSIVPISRSISSCDGKIVPKEFESNIDDIVYNIEIIPSITGQKVSEFNKEAFPFPFSSYMEDIANDAELKSFFDKITDNLNRVAYDVLPGYRAMLFAENNIKKMETIIINMIAFTVKYPNMSSKELILDLIAEFLNTKINDGFDLNLNFFESLFQSASDYSDIIIDILYSLDAYKNAPTGSNVKIDIDSAINNEVFDNMYVFMKSKYALENSTPENTVKMLRSNIDSARFSNYEIKEVSEDASSIILQAVKTTIENLNIELPITDLVTLPSEAAETIMFVINKLTKNDLLQVLGPDALKSITSTGDITSYYNNILNAGMSSLRKDSLNYSQAITLQVASVYPDLVKPEIISSLISSDFSKDRYSSGQMYGRYVQNALMKTSNKMLSNKQMKDIDPKLANMLMKYYINEQYDSIIKARVDGIRNVLENNEFDQVGSLPDSNTLVNIGKINGLGFKHAENNAKYNFDLTGKELKEQIRAEFSKSVDVDLIESNVMKVSISSDRKNDVIDASLELDKYVSGNHGGVRPLVRKVYHIDMDRTLFDEFIEKDKLNIKSDSKGKTEKFMVHGTGAIAMAFISRFGFRDIPSGVGIEIAGKMLGNGIYLAKNVDKSLSYIGNSGFSRRDKDFGYLIECEVCLGEFGVDYLDGRDHKDLISPEWVAYKFSEQILVKKIYKLNAVDGRTFKQNTQYD